VERPADLLRYYRGRLERVASEVGPGPVNTDDNGWLEHRAPLDLLAAQSGEEILGWNDATAADLARSLKADPARAAALLEDASARAAAQNDPGAAEGLRRARLFFVPR
jgi:hypothetical protein